MSRASYLRRTYGITEADYDRMVEEQGGKCFLCNKVQRRKRLSIDHDHVTGRVRALLCSRCNEGLGRFEWSDAVLATLVGYVIDILNDRNVTL